MLRFISSLSPQPKVPFSMPSTQKTHTAVNFQGTSGAFSTLKQLTKTGLEELEARKLNILLSETGDFPYHAGKLTTGQIFIVSNQDRLFLGQSDKLTELPVKESFRTRCIGNQKRVIESADGLRVTIENMNGIRTAKLSMLDTKSDIRKELAVVKLGKPLVS